MSKTPIRNFNNEDINPCVKESGLSMKCLEDEMYDYSKCKLFFDNYNNCKKFWGKLSKQRKLAGIKPVLPTKEEREKIIELRKKGIDVISAKEME